jgi:hypothetical protein
MGVYISTYVGGVVGLDVVLKVGEDLLGGVSQDLAQARATDRLGVSRARRLEMVKVVLVELLNGRL